MKSNNINYQELLRGIPSCCTEKPSNTDGIFKGTGFNPCSTHSRMQPEKLFRKINKDNKLGISFPFTKTTELNQEILQDVSDDFKNLFLDIHGISMAEYHIKYNKGSAVTRQQLAKLRARALVILADYNNVEFIKLSNLASRYVSQYLLNSNDLTIEDYVLKRIYLKNKIKR